ncbi:hypothetical protein S40285_05094 [Stachybotrys chlorohalonatus IBT 40285]|uniref:lytic cellulose monooxygenase (C4-dehydrogenating) n=1 Tax=Stachybotrys chlorohalonatus (strain IBT 40285) TaxID=1283841 RepID=A0A084QQH3_STAC4|nr:hypothetical protein S40285_05094 [Stachybotrys chlorohalonata IBT 40285]
MHLLAAAVVAAAIVPSVLAHYNFEALIHQGRETAPYAYVRRVKNVNSPILDVRSSDIICNQGGIDDDVLAATGTYRVAAGDEVGFKINEYLGHPGPLAVYLSRAPNGNVQTYKGDGDWFKIYQATTSNLTADPIHWASFVGGGVRSFTFTLPRQLPSGQYLMRAEHLALHGAGTFGQAQFYMGCAQIEVTNGGTGTPGPLVRFPGAYTGYEPGILINMYWPPVRNYTAPGPVTWPNRCEDHVINVNGQPSTGDCTPHVPGAGGTGQN